MQTLTNYLIESSVSLGVLTSFYMLAFRHTRQLQFKRFYLLFSLAFAAVLPFFHLHFFWMESPVEQLEQSGASNVLSTLTVVAGEWNSITENGMPVVTKRDWITWLYGAGMLLFLIRFIVGLARLGLMRNLHAPERTGKYRLFITSGNYRPFSFFRLVFIPETLWHSPAGEVIFTHEKEHARQYHSIDILLLELVLMVQWFNPFVWIVRRQMKDNHEFMADRAVLNSGVKRTDYLQSMLVQMMGPQFEMANNFSLSITQKRIKMMKSNKLENFLVGKALLALVLCSALFVTFACENNKAEIPEVSSTEELMPEEEKVAAIDIDDEQIFMVVEQMPEYPGGQDSLMRYLANTIKYPSKAHESRIQGRVFVSFVVDRTGKIQNVETLRSVDFYLDAEAERVVKNMPDWTPGYQRGIAVNVKYALPINFVLQGEDKVEPDMSNTEGSNQAEPEVENPIEEVVVVSY